MDITEVLDVSLEAIRTNKLRSVLTALGVIIGVGAIIMLVSITAGLQKYVSVQFEKLGANTIFIVPGKVEFGAQGGPPRSINKISFAIAQKLEGAKGGVIADVIPNIEISVTASYHRNSKITTLLGTTTGYLTSFDFVAQKGRIFTQRDNESGRKVAVIGETISHDLFGSSNPIGKTLLVTKQPVKIIGILAKQGNVGGIDVDNIVIVPIATARRLTGADQVNSIVVKSPSSQTLDLTKKAVEKILLRSLSEDDFTLLTQQQLLSSILGILGFITIALGGIAAISLLVGGVGISNIMLVSVTERTKEIGLRKALGATPSDILYQFLTEAIILSFAGGLIGVGVGYLGSLIINQFIQTSVPLWAVLLGLGFSTAVGVVFGVLPAIRASRLEPIEALRHE